MVWIASGSGPHVIAQRYHDDSSPLTAVYDKRLGWPNEKPYEMETPSEFCIRVISRLKKGDKVTFKGVKPHSIRQRAYNHGYDTGVVYQTRIRGSDVDVEFARLRV